MRALLRMAATAVAGAALYYAGLVNSIVILRPERPGADRTTPLRLGEFASVAVYPTDDQLDAAWDLRAREGGNVEFVSRPSYPALSFLLIIPFVALGWDTNRLYVLCLIAAMALVVL